ncbi:LAGLIDADG family homing endonuclease [Priestia megaterium]|uniref:LAGLIDADG family homing endonuclease n=1 Tax=Priestia megaterium TaxID=1404 RepID=UPI002877A887|nr:LAGLIDADG family homing endonuclease [Priestia megaterium]
MDFKVKRGYLNSPIFTEDQASYIVEQYLNNKDVSLLSLSKEFEVSPQMIKKLLISKDIELKTLRQYQLIYNLNENFFDEINNEEKAYWLGFLYADGVINEDENLVRINLKSEDREHLEKFKLSVGSTHPVKDTVKKSDGKNYYGVYVGFKSSHMVKMLVSKGCYQRKSLSLMFPSFHIVPKHLAHHFIRGYFDGDGCISYTTKNTEHSNRRLYKISILGTENVVDNIKELLGSTAKTYKYTNKCEISMGGNQQCIKIYEYLYKDATIYLQRKHNKFQEMLSYVENNPYIPWNKK